jgi:shikimate dehydrogenase
MHPIYLGVVGKNIQYSLSPRIHSRFAADEGIDLIYTIEEVGEGLFEKKIAALRQAQFLGCNITVPFKEEAYRLADEKTSRALQAGAANTFLFEAGKIVADNTDGIGLIQDLQHNLGLILQGKRLLICGAGGATRGILGPLLAHNPAQIVLANRSIDKAVQLQTFFASHLLTASTYEALAGQAFDLVIDSTSLKTEPLPLPDTLHFNPHACIYDLKYGANTPTLAWAKARGIPAYDGIGMLIEQAAAAFKIWTGHTPRTNRLLAEFR